MHGFAAVAVAVAAVSTAIGARRIVRRSADVLALGWLGEEAVTAVFALGAWLTVTALFGRIFQSFDVGLGASALAGVALAYFSPPAKARPEHITGRPGWFTRVAFVAALAIVAVFYINVSWRYQMHDEHGYYHHKAILEEMRHGYYPPYPAIIPGEESKYHYGYDVFAAALARGFGLSSDTALDLVCIALALLMCIAAGAVAVDAGAARSAPFAALAIHFGAGLAAFLLAGVDGRHPRCLIQYHHPTCGVELFPTQLLNVFQHPVAVGVPMWLVVVLLAPRLAGVRVVPPNATRASWIAAGLLIAILPALSIGQLVYYTLGSLAAVACLPFWLRDRAREDRLPTIVRFLAVFVLSLIIARALGGMFAPSDMHDPGLLLRRSRLGFPEKTSVTGILYHHVVNLGLGFALLPLLGVFILRDRRPASLQLLAFALGGIVVAHLFVYVRSWDIVKFPSAASFALSMLIAIELDRRLVDRGWPRAILRRAIQVAAIGTGVLAATYLFFPQPPGKTGYDPNAWKADPQVARAIDWLWANGYRKEELVYAQSNITQELAVFGGLSVPGEDADLYYHGFKTTFFQQQTRHLGRIKATMALESLRALGIRWLVLSDEETRNLGAEAQRMLTGSMNGPFELRAILDDPGRADRRRRIWRVRD
jgi:hypothetical protein